MLSAVRERWRRLGSREKRLLFYLVIVLGVAAWKFIPRPWKPTIKIDTPHYAIASTATGPQTQEMGGAIEFLYNAYSASFSQLPTFQTNHAKLKLLLYKDRAEFRRINPGVGWAEAFYRRPYCRAYYSADEVNPLHWMLHEAVHQLNEEVAGLELGRWIEEGIAEYFSTSQIRQNELMPGQIDPNTYPVWWIDEIATDADLAKNIENGSVIPLRAVITNRGGPLMRTHVNLYYLHWWTLAHFIFEKHRDAATKLLETGGDLHSFERLVGPVEQVQTNWHNHVRGIKTGLASARRQGE